MAGPRRFPIHLGWIRPLLLLFGTKRENSYVDIDDESVEFRMGPLFRRRVPLAEVKGAEPRFVHFLWGYGWRTNFVDTIGLLPSHRGVVRVEIDPPIRSWINLRLRPIRYIAVAVEDPDGLVRQLS